MKQEKVLRLIFRQPTAHYRVSFTQQNLHRTLPLPPPSTVIGMLHNLMGCQTGQIIQDFDIAICGKYESVFFQYQLFRNILKPAKSAYREAHPGSPMPNQVQLLYNVYLRIYIRFGDHFDDVNDISQEDVIEKLRNPSMPFIIGRREDLAILENREIDFIDIYEQPLPESLEFNHWLSQETAEDFNLYGPMYLLGTFYQLQEGIRNFDRQRFVYAETQPIDPIKQGNRYTDPSGWVDEDRLDGEKVSIPVFFLGIDKKES